MVILKFFLKLDIKLMKEIFLSEDALVSRINNMQHSYLCQYNEGSAHISV